MTLTTVAAVHEQISTTAAEEANRLARAAGLVDAGHDPFHPSSHRARGGISLSYDHTFAVGKDGAWEQAMNDVAVEGARIALVTHADLVAGLVVGHARRGEDYFSFF
jgi:hypothetical protein